MSEQLKGSRNRTARAMYVNDSLSEWYASVITQSSQVDGRCALHGDFHLDNVLWAPETNTLYIIDTSLNALPGTAQAAWLDVHMYLMSLLGTVFPRLDLFARFGSQFLNAMEFSLLNSPGLITQLRVQLVLWKYMITESLSMGNFKVLFRWVLSSPFITIFLICRTLRSCFKFNRSD